MERVWKLKLIEEVVLLLQDFLLVAQEEHTKQNSRRTMGKHVLQYILPIILDNSEIQLLRLSCSELLNMLLFSQNNITRLNKVIKLNELIAKLIIVLSTARNYLLQGVILEIIYRIDLKSNAKVKFTSRELMKCYNRINGKNFLSKCRSFLLLFNESIKKEDRHIYSYQLSSIELGPISLNYDCWVDFGSTNFSIWGDIKEKLSTNNKNNNSNNDHSNKYSISLSFGYDSN